MACFRNVSYAATRVYTPGRRAKAQPMKQPIVEVHWVCGCGCLIRERIFDGVQ
jgi:hypothetical protein